MAKRKKSKAKADDAQPEAESKKRGPPAIEKPKYGVPYLAEQLGIIPASVRVALRKSDVEKPGRMWGWDTKKDADAVVAALRSKVKADETDETEPEAEPEAEKKKKKRRGKK